RETLDGIGKPQSPSPPAQVRNRTGKNGLGTLALLLVETQHLGRLTGNFNQALGRTRRMLTRFALTPQ
ncbi:hypothetical protein, partial [Vibrio coralliilyticus]|uniref:hypothetical protein n=1 Tax=Vibrio coralliilyticus TaxID=190893 RepID=UPI001C0F8546